MPWVDCSACQRAGQSPIQGKGVRIVFDPGIQMPGPPTIEGHRLGAEFIADIVFAHGFKDAQDDYELTREELLLACWWAGLWGPRKWKTRWGEWAKAVNAHLWYGCINIPDPPTKDVTP